MKFLLELFFFIKRIFLSAFAKFRNRPKFPVGTDIHFIDCSVPVVRVEKKAGKAWLYYLADKPDEAEKESYLTEIMDGDKIYRLLGTSYFGE